MKGHGRRVLCTVIGVAVGALVLGAGVAGAQCDGVEALVNGDFSQGTGLSNCEVVRTGWLVPNSPCGANRLPWLTDVPNWPDAPGAAINNFAAGGAHDITLVQEVEVSPGGCFVAEVDILAEYFSVDPGFPPCSNDTGRVNLTIEWLDGPGGNVIDSVATGPQETPLQIRTAKRINLEGEVPEDVQYARFALNLFHSAINPCTQYPRGSIVAVDNASFIVGEGGPAAPDIDGDRVPDDNEGPNIGLPAGSSNILLVDSDGDGLWDGVEDANRNGTKDASETSTRNRDTDGDNFEDGIEVLLGQNPLVANAGYADADGDGLPDAQDSNDAAKDSDADGFDDGYEAAWFQSVAAASSAAQKPPLADVNGDASVANLDALVMQALFLGIIDHTAAVFDQGPAHIDGFRFGDPSRDGFVTSLDALVAQSFFLGNLATLPLRF